MQNGDADSKQPETTEPELERVPASEARDRLTDLMNRAHYRGHAFVLTRNGEDMALIVGFQFLDRLLAKTDAATSAAA